MKTNKKELVKTKFEIKLPSLLLETIALLIVVTLLVLSSCSPAYACTVIL